MLPNFTDKKVKLHFTTKNASTFIAAFWKGPQCLNLWGLVKDCDWSAQNVCRVKSLFWATVKKIYEEKVCQIGLLTLVSEREFPG